LFLVPFAALQDTQGQYLIDSHTLAIAPSIQVLDLTQQQQLRHTQGHLSATKEERLTPALVVGNPTMPKLPAQMGKKAETLSPLPGAEQEAQAIAPLLGSQAITGEAATKVAIVQQMGEARLIHLATHGLLDDFKGMGVPGALALAPSGQDSGLLTADEILDLKLQAELVVLSACDTGRGRITGDGIIGLSRSFITAGVPSLVVSLWAVPDFSTAFLMTEFYRTLKQGQDKAQSLRQAMLATKQQYPDPRQWAAFTLIGGAD
jgi:CHAT domain-containing protein